jgi:hypothetical protein
MVDPEETAGAVADIPGEDNQLKGYQGHALDLCQGCGTVRFRRIDGDVNLTLALIYTNLINFDCSLNRVILCVPQFLLFYYYQYS